MCIVSSWFLFGKLTFFDIFPWVILFFLLIVGIIYSLSTILLLVIYVTDTIYNIGLILTFQLELQLLTYDTATATQDLSRIWEHSSRQCHIPNPLSKVRDWTLILRILVRFVSAVPQQEFPIFLFLMALFYK